MNYKEQLPKLPSKTHFSTFTEKDYPYILYIYTINCKEPVHFKPRSGKTIHFPIKNYLNLHFELEDNTKVYPSIPYTYFSQKFKDIFQFLDMIVSDKNKDSCSTVIQNFTSHPATLPRGLIGYIEIPITQTAPPHYRVQDVNSLIHSVIHAYHPDITIPIRQNDYTDMNICTRGIPQSQLENNKIEITDKTLQLPIPSVTGNLRPSYKISITIHMPVRTSRILLVRFLSNQSANIFLEVLHFSHITRIDRPLHSLILLRTLTSLHHWIVQ